MERHNWADLSKPELNQYAKSLFKEELTRIGFNVDIIQTGDRATSLAIWKNNKPHHKEAHVRAVRGLKYIYYLKSKFILSEMLFAAVALFFEGQRPQLYLIRSTEWKNPTSLLKSRDYPGKKSDPEWGITLSKKNMPLLAQFEFDKIVKSL